MKQAYIAFAKQFEMADDKTRFAIADLTATQADYAQIPSRILLPLSGDRTGFEAKMTQYNPKEYARTTNADGSIAVAWVWKAADVVKAIEQQVFNGASSGRAQVVIFPFVGKFSGQDKEYEKEATRLRDEKNVWIYAITRNPEKASTADNSPGVDMPTIYDRAKREAEKLADNRQRLIIMDVTYPRDGIDDALIKVKEALLREVCGWSSMCRFTDANRTECKLDVEKEQVTPYLNDAAACGMFKPQGSCTGDLCNQECDDK